ncbi:MAG TPA: carbohydrate ABC transporter permease [Candidatus Limiplasma sp.]|nr:carbohydrate ABC transporter permease [Candidatus Limiplasma sp.]HPS82655.1 carbohydrate ABC transporter permease [Candidatus Limiplasma sp.]
MKENKGFKLARILVLALICLMCAIPFYVLLVLSLNAPSRVFYEGNLFVPTFAWGNYADAWAKSRIGTAMVNSAVITFGTLGLTILLGGMAGYAIARRNNAFNRAVFSLLIGCMMIPGIINTVPLYTLMRGLGAINTLWGMVLVCSTLCMPSAVFIYTTFVRALPRELDEAAEVDGCTGFKAFWKIIFPVLKPATASFVILNGFGVWNNYAQAVFFLQSREKQNIPQALSVFFQQFGGAKWHLMSATAVIAIIPVVVIFLVFQRQFIEGLTEGAVKG